MSEERMRVNLAEGSVSFCFPSAAAEALRQEIQALMERMRAIANAASGSHRAATCAASGTKVCVCAE
ncbi:hypothetical protein [Thermosynechococcus sp.]|uniref:hypothetical protein n=1 Tax=Thermosynechococcus sp. TaxID=2814275 RepID=UPI00391B5326